MRIQDAADRCAVCGKLAAALTPNRRCAPCRRAEVQGNCATAAKAKRGKMKNRSGVPRP